MLAWAPLYISEKKACVRLLHIDRNCSLVEVHKDFLHPRIVTGITIYRFSGTWATKVGGNANVDYFYFAYILFMDSYSDFFDIG